MVRKMADTINKNTNYTAYRMVCPNPFVLLPIDNGEIKRNIEKLKFGWEFKQKQYNIVSRGRFTVLRMTLSYSNTW